MQTSKPRVQRVQVVLRDMDTKKTKSFTVYQATLSRTLSILQRAVASTASERMGQAPAGE